MATATNPTTTSRTIDFFNGDACLELAKLDDFLTVLELGFAHYDGSPIDAKAANGLYRVVMQLQDVVHEMQDNLITVRRESAIEYLKREVLGHE